MYQKWYGKTHTPPRDHPGGPVEEISMTEHQTVDDLAAAKARKLEALDAWKTARFAAGIRVADASNPAEPYVWAASHERGGGQEQMIALYQGCLVSLGQGADRQKKMVSVDDHSSGSPRGVVMTVARFFDLLHQYSEKVQEVYGEYLDLRAQIGMARDTAALEALPF